MLRAVIEYTAPARALRAPVEAEEEVEVEAKEGTRALPLLVVVEEPSLDMRREGKEGSTGREGLLLSGSSPEW